MAATCALFIGEGRVAMAAAPPSAVIDIHHHYYPPSYLQRRRSDILAATGGISDVQTRWTPAQSVAAMDQAGVQKAILSIAAPGIWFGDAGETKLLARECNLYAAELARIFPGRFGFFATLPLPDVGAALAELAFALDHLGAAGAGLLTNYDGHYLGDPAFEPIFAELDRRKATAFVHPRICDCSKGAGVALPSGLLELPFDTTRTVADLLFSGTVLKYRDLHLIFSHGGGALPMVSGRMQLSPKAAEMYPRGLQEEFDRFYYDTTSISTPSAVSALKSFAPLSQMMFGTDYPHGIIRSSSDIMKIYDLSHAELSALMGGNARKLLNI